MVTRRTMARFSKPTVAEGSLSRHGPTAATDAERSSIRTRCDHQRGGRRADAFDRAIAQHDDDRTISAIA